MECPFRARNERRLGCPRPASTNKPPLEVGTIPGTQRWGRQRGESTHVQALQQREDRAPFRGHTRTDRLSPRRRSAFAQKHLVFGPTYSLDTSHLRSRSEEHTSELQSRGHLVCRLL